MSDFWDSIVGDGGFWHTWGGEVLASVGVIVAALIIMAIVRRGLGRWAGRIEKRYQESDDHLDREQGQRIITITGVVRIVAAITVWAVVILTIMAIWGIPMTPLLAVGTTIGVAVGFGAQDFVRDVIGGFFILVEDQYAVGDIVSIADTSGTVEAITLRTTVLRDLEGAQHHVPNGEIRVSSNLTSGFSRVVVDVAVSYDTDLDTAMPVIIDEAVRMYEEDDWQGAYIEEPELLGVNELDSSSVNIRVLLTTITEDRWRVKREFLKRVKQRLDREGIEIPFPYLTVVQKDTDQSS